MPTPPSSSPSTTLFLVLDTNVGTLKAGTCQHCVLEEPPGRPERAWEAEDDSSLDFDRDTLIEKLAARGIQVKLKEQYICP